MFLVALCLKCSWLRFARNVLGSVLLEMFLVAFCLKCSWLRFARNVLDKMADMTAPTGQAPTMAPLVRIDDQNLPRIRWVPIGKRNCYLDMEKSQVNHIYKIVVDTLKNTKFFKAFTASSTIPSIYIQQFWDTI
nr:hypothetical protein [Tanacetum cinerariifolium]